MYHLNFSRYLDKVYAAWKGKCIGGIAGAYFENHKEFKNLSEGELWPETVPPNDDLDLQLLWLEAMQEKGLYLTYQDLTEIWQERCWYNFCEYGYFLHNVQRGILPPLSGSWNNEFFRESEGCPIRSDIWGLVSPGNPQLAAEFARMDGELDHCGFSVEAEMFFAAMTAQALVADTREEIFEAGLSVLPENSRVRKVVAEVCKIHRNIPELRQAWQRMIRQFGDRDASKAVTNLAIVILAWLKSVNDVEKAVRYCVCMGWDTDCTAATLAAILGAWKGNSCFPARWNNETAETLVCGIAVRHKNSTLKEIATDTAQIGIEMALSRNSCCQLTDAPACVLRPAPVPNLTWSVVYPQGPVLYAQKSTQVTFILKNPTPELCIGKIFCEFPDNVVLESTLPEEWQLKSGESRELTLAFRREDPIAPLSDKNLFAIIFQEKNGPIHRQEFGLNGARQWQIYGPYWTIYDKEKYESCPFSGPGRNQNPAWAGCCGDSYLHYQYPEEKYLDEERLLAEDIPEEVPAYIESGTDLLTADAFGGWVGSGCWYLTRTFRVPAGVKICVNLGRTGMLKVWLDGELKGDCPDFHSWSASESDHFYFTGTGKPQRLVVKLTAPGDDRSLALYFQHVGHDSVRGISYLVDSMTDFIPAENL